MGENVNSSALAGQPPKILPQKGKRNILITSALPYVNNVPHLGNIIGSLLSADVFARYCRARSINTLFICGTDEYGTATETKALEEGVTPQQLCDKYHAIHTDVYNWFRIKFDHWGRTPTQEQTDITQDIFLKCKQNGYMEETTTWQPYCEQHQSFLADRFVEGKCPECGYEDARGDQCDKCGKLLNPMDLINPRCKLDGASPVKRQTKHFFIQLDKLQPAIESWVKESTSKGVWSANGVSITETWLKEGLRPRGITRDLKWGTPVPIKGYEDKVFYVWFDACIGYVSITATYTPDWELWWRDPENVHLYQFMGKDNVPFHTVIFPGSQLGTGDTWTKIHHLSTTEYMNYEKTKFSKSRGIGVFGTNARDTGVPADVWRYYLLKNRPETSDSEFEWSSFILANNSELLNNLGNFVNRLLKFTVSPKTYNGVVPDYRPFLASPQATSATDIGCNLVEWQETINRDLAEYIADLEAVKLRSGLATAMRIAASGNLLLQANTLDNRLFAAQPDRCAAVVGLGVNLVHLLAALVAPYMPDTSDAIREQLGSEADGVGLVPLATLPIPDTFVLGAIPPGHRLGEPKHLFTMIKPTQEDVWKDRFGGDETRKVKEEVAAKKAAKKVEQQRRKEKKKAAGAAGAEGTEESVHGATAETVEKQDAAKLDGRADDGDVDEITEGVHAAALQSS